MSRFTSDFNLDCIYHSSAAYNKINLELDWQETLQDAGFWLRIHGFHIYLTIILHDTSDNFSKRNNWRRLDELVLLIMGPFQLSAVDVHGNLRKRHGPWEWHLSNCIRQRHRGQIPRHLNVGIYSLFWPFLLVYILGTLNEMTHSSPFLVRLYNTYEIPKQFENSPWK